MKNHTLWLFNRLTWKIAHRNRWPSQLKTSIYKGFSMAMHGYVSHNQRVNHPTFTQLLGLRRSSVFTCFYASPHGFMNGPCGSRLKMGPQLSLTIIVHANSRWCVYIYIYYWLVVWNHGILWLSIYWGESSQLTNSYLSEGLKPPTRLHSFVSMIYRQVHTNFVSMFFLINIDAIYGNVFPKEKHGTWMKKRFQTLSGCQVAHVDRSLGVSSFRAVATQGEPHFVLRIQTIPMKLAIWVYHISKPYINIYQNHILTYIKTIY